MSEYIQFSHNSQKALGHLDELLAEISALEEDVAEADSCWLSLGTPHKRKAVVDALYEANTKLRETIANCVGSQLNSGAALFEERRSVLLQRVEDTAFTINSMLEMVASELAGMRSAGGASPQSDSDSSSESDESDESDEGSDYDEDFFAGDTYAARLYGEQDAHIVVPGTHRAWTQHEYRYLKQAITDKFGVCIKDTLGGTLQGQLQDQQNSLTQALERRITRSVALERLQQTYSKRLELAAACLPDDIPYGFEELFLQHQPPFPLDLFDRGRQLNAAGLRRRITKLKEMRVPHKSQDIIKISNQIDRIRRDTSEVVKTFAEDVAILAKHANRAPDDALMRLFVKSEPGRKSLKELLKATPSMLEILVLELLFASKLASKLSKPRRNKGSWIRQGFAETRLYLEIRIALRDSLTQLQAKLNSATSALRTANRKQLKKLTTAVRRLESHAHLVKLLLNLFHYKHEVDEVEAKRIVSQPQLVFNPLVVKLVRSEGGMKMKPEQVEFARMSEGLVDKFSKCILGETPWPDAPEAVVNTNTFGGGKTSVASYGTSFQIHQANNALAVQSEHRNRANIRAKRIDIEQFEHEKLYPPRIVGLYILPSLESVLSFASATAHDYCTWFAQQKHFNISFKWRPLIMGRGKKKQKHRTYNYMDGGTFKVAGLRLQNLPMLKEAKKIIDWHRVHRDGTGKNARLRNMFVNGHRKHPPPDIIFADPDSALEILRNKEEYQRLLGWHFLPIVDEFPATGDCTSTKEDERLGRPLKIKLEANQMLQSIRDILSMKLPFSILMSASPTEAQLQMSPHFSAYRMQHAPLIRDTKSFTQLYLSDGRPVHPLSALTPDQLDRAVPLWDETVFRCFPPQVYLGLLSLMVAALPEKCSKLVIEDTASPASLIAAIRRLCLLIADAETPTSVKQAAIDFVGQAPPPEHSPRTTLTLVSGSLRRNVLRLLGRTGVTKHKIKKVRAALLKSYRDELQELRLHEAEMRQGNGDGGQGRQSERLERIAALEDILAPCANTFKDVPKYFLKFKTVLGPVRVSEWWVNTYAAWCPDDEEATDPKTGEKYFVNPILSLMMAGVEVDLRNDFMNDGLYRALYPARGSAGGSRDPTATVRRHTAAISTITCLYSLNDPKIDHVHIMDSEHIMGLDSLMQGLARAGRSGQDNFVVTGIIDDHLLRLFDCQSRTSIATLDALQNEERNAALTTCSELARQAEELFLAIDGASDEVTEGQALLSEARDHLAAATEGLENGVDVSFKISDMRYVINRLRGLLAQAGEAQ